MRGFPSRLLKLAEARLPALTRYRRPENLPIDLHRRRIYIVPTAFGLGFSVLLLVMLVGALNYANNAALLLTCLLAAASATSMLVAFRSLNGLTLRQIRCAHAIAGQPLELSLSFDATRASESIHVDLERRTVAFAMEAGGTATVKISLQTSRRGWLTLPRMRVWTHWPLGMFRAWSWLHPEQSVLVWPLAEVAGPPPQASTDDPRHMRLHQGDEFAALRDYRAGDAPRHVAWKASARHENLLVRDFEQPQPQPHWQLDWHQLRGLDDEARIARLARWLGEARAQRRSYSLHLPDERIASGSGPIHYAQCMNALAQLP